MKRNLLAALILVCASAAAPAPEAGEWGAATIAQLRKAIDEAPLDALPLISTGALDAAERSEDSDRLDKVADELALKLARMHLLGRASASERTGWKIVDTDREIDLDDRLHVALATGTVEHFFAGLKPRHPDYLALRAAHAAEQDPALKADISRNMERWRWMPQSLGQSYVLVNAANFTARLWRRGQLASTWRVINGKPKTPTPVFSARITGVTFNPWWEVPSSIVRESVGSLIRRNPSLARSRGYVWGDGRVRQKPGPNNALGQMKLVMPNPYSVYLHDTPNRELFEQDLRAFSHGCVRVGNALDFATALFDGKLSRAQVDEIVATTETRSVDLPEPLPIYITYFTVEAGDGGTVTPIPDLYKRDARITAIATEKQDQCPVVQLAAM